MLSRLKSTLLLLTLLVVTSIVVTGCSYFFDKKEKETEVVFQSDHEDCLQQSHLVLKAYFNDFSNDERTSQNMTELGLCYQNAIDAFVKFTKTGEGSEDEYSAERFEQFFERFFPEMGMTLSKIQGFIEFKQLFVGGSKTTVTKEEMMSVHELLPAFTSALADLSPFRKILLQEADLSVTEVDRQKFRDAFTALKRNAGNLLHALRPWKSERTSDLNSLGQFIVNEYYADEREETEPYVGVLVSFKDLSLNERHEFLKLEDLEVFITQAVKSFEALSEYNYFIHDGDFFDNIGSVVSFIIKIPSQLTMGQKFKTITFSSLLNVLNNVHQVLSFSAKRNERDTVDMDKVGAFIQSLEGANYMSGSLTARTLTFFLKQFSKGWLISTNPEVGENLNREKLSYIKRVVEDWSSRQSYINTKFEERRSLNLQEFSTGNENSDIAMWLTIYDNTALHQWLPDGRVRHSNNTSNLNYEEMTVSNSVYTLVKFFLKPFSLDKNSVLEYSLLRDETQDVYNLLRILGVEMGFVDSRVDDTGIKSFLEGNTFTTQLANDNTLDFYEAFELMSTIFSSGMLAENIHRGFVQDSAAECVIEDQPDVLGFPVMKANCVREHFKTNFGTYFSQLETFNNYWQSASELDREKLLGVVEIAARSGVISEKPFDMGEIRVMAGTLYYLESAFYNFDSDRDGIITNQETRTAELHFRPMIEQYLITLGYEDRLHWATSLFIYLLQTGSVPEAWYEQVGYYLQTPIDVELSYRNGRFNYDQVLRVFGALAYASGSAHRQRISDFLRNEKDALFENLRSEEVPDCRIKENLPFCRWARMIYCNETVNEELFDWMKNTPQLLFPDHEWNNNENATLRRAMIRMSSFFRGHKIYSTQCSFPELEPTKTWYQWTVDGLDNMWNGTPTERGAWENVEEWWNGWRDYFNGEEE